MTLRLLKKRKFASTPATRLKSSLEPDGWRARTIAPTSELAKHVTAHAQHGVVVAGVGLVRFALHRHRAEAEAADAAGEPQAAVERVDFARVVQPDAPAEEQQQILLGRTEARDGARVARNVAEVEDAGVLEEELALLRVEEAELGQVDLLLVGFGLREVWVDRDVERQRRRHAQLEVDADLAVAVEAALADAADAAAEQEAA